jgi:hypothetical protein
MATRMWHCSVSCSRKSARLEVSLRIRFRSIGTHWHLTEELYCKQGEQLKPCSKTRFARAMLRPRPSSLQTVRSLDYSFPVSINVPLAQVFLHIVFNRGVDKDECISIAEPRYRSLVPGGILICSKV